jgi:HD-like signal output (HDOD) protein
MSAAVAERNILFVDDDPLILQGLQRMLRPMRHEWSMSFVESGAAALETLAVTPFQVVVSDMRMPGMNGAQLLAEVKNRYPKTVRLILSGYADKELILQCVGTAHQFLAKPCEPEAIKAAISRVSALEASVKCERIKKLVVQMDRIPSIPAVYTEIVEKLRDPDASIDEIGGLIAKDLAITAKLLKLVNSAFFGLCRQVSSPAEAAAYLGIDTIKSLVLGVNAFASFEGSKFPGFTLEKLWNHSLSVGAIARRIIESENAQRSFGDESFVAGMLHDIGKLVLALNLSEDYQKAFTLSEAESIPLHKAEESLFGVNHADVAGFILSLWGLPPRVVDAITFHHEPHLSGATALNPVLAVHVADAAEHQQGCSDKTPSATVDLEFLTSLGLNEMVPQWMTL